MKTVRSARVARGEPRALDQDEWPRLLRMPDRRTRQGKRDLALLHLLGSAGLRRAEASNLLVGDVDERRRSSDPRLRQAIPGSTSWWVSVHYGKRGRTRAVPLDQDALDAIAAWVKVRPPADLFAHMPPQHPHQLAVWLAEVFGGPPRYTRSTVATRTCCADTGVAITGPQRARWVELIGRAADEAGLPSDPEFRSAFMAYVEWGTRLALANSQPGSTAPSRAPLPRWGWGEAPAHPA